jgi:glycosyltransferase involved in cell wall biosynthesis
VTDQPKVLFVHGVGEIGGAERELLLIVRQLASMGSEPCVGCPGHTPLKRELSAQKIETHHASFPAWRKIFEYPRRASAVHQLRSVIQAVNPVILHVNDMWWVPQVLRASKGLGIPVVAHVRQEIEASKVSRYELSRVDLVLAVSNNIQRAVEAGGVPSERVRTLYSGFDLSRVVVSEQGEDVRTRLGIPKDTFLIGTVANLFPRKGYEVIIKALPQIRETIPQIQYLVMGQGDIAYERQLLGLVRTLGLKKNVYFTGFQDSVYPYVAALDLYVHPALMEGFGIAVLEAMALGKPVVATRTGGLPEVVQDGTTGVLVPPGDVEAIAKAVTSLFSDADHRVSMGNAGRPRVAEQFSVKTMMQSLTTMYQSVVLQTEATGSDPMQKGV